MSSVSNNTAPGRELVVKVRDIMVNNGWLFCVQVLQKDKDGSNSSNTSNTNKKKKKAKKRRILTGPPSKVLEFYFPRTTESATLKVLNEYKPPLKMAELKQVEAPTVSGLKLHIHKHLNIPPGEQRLFLCSNHNHNNIKKTATRYYSQYLGYKLDDQLQRELKAAAAGGLSSLDILFAVNKKKRDRINNNNNVTNDDRQPLYYGYLLDPYLERDIKIAAAESDSSDMEEVGTRELAEPAPSTYTMKVLLEHVPLDPKLRQLFQFSRLAYWKERDQIMQTLMYNCEAGECFCGCEMVNTDAGADNYVPLLQESEERTVVGHCLECSSSLFNVSRSSNNENGDKLLFSICPRCPLDFTTMMCKECWLGLEDILDWLNRLSEVIYVYNSSIMPTDLHEFLLMICLYLQRQRLETILLLEDERAADWDPLGECNNLPYLLNKVAERALRFEPDKDLVLLPHFHERILAKFCEADRKELEERGLQDKIAEAESLILRPWKDVDKTSSGTGQSHMALLRDFLETWTSRPVFTENLWPALENRSPDPFFFVKGYDMDEIVIGVSKKHGDAD